MTPSLMYSRPGRCCAMPPASSACTLTRCAVAAWDSLGRTFVGLCQADPGCFLCFVILTGRVADVMLHLRLIDGPVGVFLSFPAVMDVAATATLQDCWSLSAASPGVHSCFCGSQGCINRSLSAPFFMQMTAHTGTMQTRFVSCCTPINRWMALAEARQGICGTSAIRLMKTCRHPICYCLA